MPSNKTRDFAASATDKHADMRLDVFLTSEIDCSRNSAVTLIKQGLITVDSRKVKPAHKLKAGEIVTGHIPKPAPSGIVPEPRPLDILFKDSHLIVLNKPAGMVVHPAPGHARGTLVHALLNHFPEIKNVGETDRPGIVHRLDQHTSGAIVVARSSAIHEALSFMFAEKKINKQYLSITYGKQKEPAGEIDLPIGRHPINRKKRSVSGINRREAVTCWRVLKNFSDAGLLLINIKTGRTHQIRVHCSAAGMPVAGDTLYKARWTAKPTHFNNKEMFRRLQAVSRQMLHAWKLSFNHPATGESMRFIAPPPADMKILLKDLIRIEKGLEPSPPAPYPLSGL